MSSSTDEEELNMESEKFNPLKALYSKKLKLPDVKNFDNIGMFEARLKSAGNKFDVDLTTLNLHRKSKKEECDIEEVDEEKYHTTKSGRVFAKEQAPVKGRQKTKYTRNVLTRMEDAKGPLALVKKFLKNHTKVRVFIRKEHEIRGFITGFIEAFDKHLNLSMSECVEVYKRRKYKFCDNKVILGEPEDCSNLIKKMGFNNVIKTKSIDRKHVECERRYKKLCIRGEEIVLISENYEN